MAIFIKKKEIHKVSIPVKIFIKYGQYIRGKPIGSCILFLILLVFIPLVLHSISLPCYGSDLSYPNYDACLLDTLKRVDNNTPASKIKASCEKYLDRQTQKTEEEQPKKQERQAYVSRRISYEIKNHTNPFALTPHKQNYILVGSYNSQLNGGPLQIDESEVDHTEVKFQVSVKVPLLRNFIGKDNGYLYAAYTARSFWQAYNDDVSSPFRETNHEPELFVGYRNDKQIFGLNNTFILAGFSHQSNGRRGSLSRSWNRLYLNLIFEKDNFALSFKPWYRIPESLKTSSLDPRGDDNPDISRFLGYGELTAAYKYRDHTFSMMLRNNLRTRANKGAVELGWSFPLPWFKLIKGYMQYFNGYGESLIDYNASANRIGLGLLLTDWL